MSDVFDEYIHMSDKKRFAQQNRAQTHRVRPLPEKEVLLAGEATLNKCVQLVPVRCVEVFRVEVCFVFIRTENNKYVTVFFLRFSTCFPT